MKNRVTVVMFGFFVLALAAAVRAEEKFPYRAKYPTVPTISTKELKDQYDQNKVVVVDVRSNLEYDVIHIKNAIHVPVAYLTFVDEIKKLTVTNKGKNLAFYCNGITCLKAYEATERAKGAIPGDIFFAYDAGVPEWALLFPKATLLFGKEITDPQKQLISNEDFEKKCLSFEEFKKAQNNPNALYVNVRDPIQSAGPLPELQTVLNQPLDKFLNYIRQNGGKDKTLYIFDQVGKQVEWLMYYLEENGYKNYWFLSKGATGVLEQQKYQK